MTERVTITVEASVSHGDFLTVQDAMRQVLDFFELLDRSSPDRSEGIEWRLVKIKMESPLEATAEAFCSDPEMPPPVEVARASKIRAKAVLRAVTSGASLPEWVAEQEIAVARRLATRNLNGIGKTTFGFEDKADPVILFERSARTAIEAIQQVERNRRMQNAELAGEEFGSIEGDVIETTTYFHKPALRVREHLTGERVVCVLSDELATRVGPEFSWSETWQGKTVELSGLIKRDENGRIVLVRVEDMTRREYREFDVAGARDAAFTNGKSPHEYLRDVWGDSDD